MVSSKLKDGQKWSYHPKLYLIKFSKFLRVLIGSPNLFMGDWICWENCFYLKDFQLNITNSPNESTFKKDLLNIMAFSLGDQIY